MEIVPILEQAKEKLSAIVAESGLEEENVQIIIAPLSAQEALGSPSRGDFALLEGKEVMIEAQFKRSFGQAFTDEPQSFRGRLKDVLSLSLNTKKNRGILTATMNAVVAYRGMANGVRHCRDQEPEACGAEIAKNLLRRFGKIKIGLVGYQPAILENLILSFSAHNIRCSDLNPKNVGSQKFGVKIWDGRTDNRRLINWSDVLLVTSSAIVNSTFERIREDAIAQRKHLITFGVTGAGVSALMGLERLCFFAH